MLILYSVSLKPCVFLHASHPVRALTLLATSFYAQYPWQYKQPCEVLYTFDALLMLMLADKTEKDIDGCDDYGALEIEVCESNGCLAKNGAFRVSVSGHL